MDPSKQQPSNPEITSYSGYTTGRLNLRRRRCIPIHTYAPNFPQHNWAISEDRMIDHRLSFNHLAHQEPENPRDKTITELQTCGRIIKYTCNFSILFGLYKSILQRISIQPHNHTKRSKKLKIVSH